MAFVTGISFEAGYMIIQMDSGPPVKQDIASVLRALDIPTGLTYSQVGTITTLANLVVVLIRTLIDKKILGDTFLENGDYNLDDIIETIEGMGGDFVTPDLTVS